MTDQELIQRLQEDGPAALTPAELELLRQRLPVSPELQQFVFSEIKLEETLAAALGRPGVSAERLMRQAAAASPARRWAARLGWLVTSLLVIGGGLTWWQIHHRKPPVPPPQRTLAQSATNPSAGKPNAEAPSPEPVPPDKAAARDADPKPPESAASPPTPQVVPEPPKPIPTPQGPADISPWPELDVAKNPPKPLAETAYVDIATLPGLSQQELRRWLEPVPGQPHRFFEDRRGNVACSGFEHLVRLKSPWPQRAVLRFAPFEHEGLAIHLWAGTQGVSLLFHQQYPQGWSAYSTTRTGAGPRPVTYSFVATDNDRYDRTAAGILELRHQAGAIVLSRGPLRLLTVPLDEAPSETYFDRRAWFRTFAMYLGEPVPDELSAEAPSLLADLPSSLRWETHVETGARFETYDHGAVRLAADKSAATSWAGVRLPRKTVCEYIVHLEEMAPGTGIYLGDDAGRPLHVIGYSREKRTGWTTFGPLARDAAAFESQFEMGPRPVPVSHRSQWLRLVLGAGTLKCWTSGDGLHWSRAADPIRNVRGGVSHLGLICFKHDQPRSITLRRMQVRELVGITELAVVDLLDDVPAVVANHTGNLPGWLTLVLDSQPADADAAEWRNTCAVRTLAAPAPNSLGNLILAGLLEEHLSQPRPIEQRLRLLNQAAELFDAWEAPECFRLVRQYEQLGLRLIREGHPQPWTTAGQSLLSAPVWTAARYSPVPDTVFRAEVLGVVHRDDWDAADELCDRLRFFSQPCHPEGRWPDQREPLRLLVDWVQGAPEPVSRNRDQRRRKPARREGVTATPARFRHPLVVDLSKEGFNTLAEVQAALSEGAWREACQIISSSQHDAALGLLPDASDGRLLASLPQAVAAAMRDHPPLRTTMLSEFGPIARLRVQQAMGDGNAAALEAAAVQFYGTAAAVDARRWLGDRWLAAGEFARAAGAFEQALSDAAPEQRAALATRVRLTAALLGREMPSANDPLVLQDLTIPAPELEQLVADLRQRLSAGTTQSVPVPVEMKPVRVPKAVRYQVAQRLPWPGEKGKNPANFLPGDADAFGWQLHGQVVGDVLYTTNRFSVLAVDLPALTVKWHQPLGSEPGEAHAWHLGAMRPVVTNDRLFLRRITKDGPELVALENATGNVVWKKQIPETVIASDPLLMQDALLVFTATFAQDGLLHVGLTALHPAAGEVLWQRPLVRLIDVWNRQPPCTVAQTGGRLIAAIGGSVLCCDATGQLAWVRRQAWIPPSHEPLVWNQVPLPPWISGERVVVTQPGVTAVECLDLGSGRRVWHRALPDVRRVVAVSGGRAIVEGDGRLCGFNLDDGSLAWEKSIERLQAGALAAAEGQLLVIRADRYRDNQPARPRLAWIDAISGNESATWPLDVLQEKLPRLGPLFLHNDRLIAFWGRNEKDIERELVALSPTEAPALAETEPAHPLRSWVASTLDPQVAWAASCTLPDWLCLGSDSDAVTGLVAELRGQADVCSTLAAADRPVAFVRDVAVPAGKKTRLDVHVGCQSGESWTLEIRAAGRTLEALRIEDKSTANGWKELRVDLSAFAGRGVTIVVEQQHSGKPAHAYWKKLAVVSE